MIRDYITSNDHLYFTVVGKTGYLSLPLCEVLNGELVPDKSSPPAKYVFRAKDKATGESVEHPITGKELADSCLSVLLEMQVHEFVIQPARMPMTNEVVDFLQRHNAQ